MGRTRTRWPPGTATFWFYVLVGWSTRSLNYWGDLDWGVVLGKKKGGESERRHGEKGKAWGRYH